MTEPLNITVLALLLTTWGWIVCTALSPDALDILARKMRARARAIRISRQYWQISYNESIREDVARDRERNDMADLVHTEYAQLAKGETKR